MGAAQILDPWDHKDAWRRRGKDFMVEVTRYSVAPPSEIEFALEGSHRWCLYAYVYPKHPYFAAFSGPNMWQDATARLHLHGGCSLLEYPMYEGKVSAVKVGADYNHLHDDHFTRYSTRAEAYSIFEDAEELFEQLQRLATAGGAAA